MVGVAAIHDDTERPGLPLGLDGMKCVECDLIEVALFHGLFVGRPFFRRLIFPGLSRRGGVYKVDGNHTALAVGIGNAGGKLDHTLSPDEIDIERRPQRVFSIGRPWDKLSGFTENGVVEREDQRGLGSVEVLDVIADASKEDLRVNPLLCVKIIMGGPIGKLPPVGGD